MYNFLMFGFAPFLSLIRIINDFTQITDFCPVCQLYLTLYKRKFSSAIFAFLSKLLNALTVRRHHLLAKTFFKLVQVMIFIIYLEGTFRFPTTFPSLKMECSTHDGAFMVDIFANQLVPHDRLLPLLARYKGLYFLSTSKTLSKGQLPV